MSLPLISKWPLFSHSQGVGWCGAAGGGQQARGGAGDAGQTSGGAQGKAEWAGEGTPAETGHRFGGPWEIDNVWGLGCAWRCHVLWCVCVCVCVCVCAALDQQKVSLEELAERRLEWSLRDKDRELQQELRYQVSQSVQTECCSVSFMGHCSG